MRGGSRFPIRLAEVLAGLTLAGTALAQFPQGQQTGSSPQSSGALVSLAFPAVLGVNVGHNFVLDFNSATKCWGSGSTQSAFPQAASGSTTYTFAVSGASVAGSANVACPGEGAQSDLAMVQVISTLGAASHLQSFVADGGEGAQTTKFTDLIPDIFTANRLLLSARGGDSCGGGSKVSPLRMTTSPANEVTAIPATAWSSCQQTLSLTLDSATAVKAGTVTGILTFTMVSP